MDITFSAPVNKLSYGYCTSYFIKELSKLGHKISLFPLGSTEETNEFIQPALKNAENSSYNEIVIKLYHQNLLHNRIGKGKHYGFPIFELDTFDQQEKNSINSCDSLIVPTKWAADVCKNNNISVPIDIVPLGVDRDIFYENDLPLTDEIWYYNIGKWEVRKYHDLLSLAFAKAFDSSKYKVKLFMLPFSNSGHYHPNELNDWEKLYKTNLGDKVIILKRLPGQEDVANLIRKCHCGIFPSRAEGWNLPLLETLSCGRYAIASNCTAHTEFINEDNCFLLPANNKVVAKDGKWFNGKGNWHDINIDDVIDQLRYSYDFIQSKNEINVSGIKTANNFTWKKAAERLVNVVS